MAAIGAASCAKKGRTGLSLWAEPGQPAEATVRKNGGFRPDALDSSLVFYYFCIARRALRTQRPTRGTPCGEQTREMMTKSMTGFGKGEATLKDKKITVEIRSLNSKQLDLSLRLPALYRQSEYEIRTLAARRLVRGKVDIYVTVENQKIQTPARIDRELFREYVGQAKQAAEYAGIEASADALTTAVLRMPEVVATQTEAVSEEEHAALLAATEAAADRLDAFRTQEGEILMADLLRRVELIERYKEEVVPYEKDRTETVKARILENLSKLNAEVDRNRLEQEMIFYLEKLDITEEKVRLTNHCNYFREVARSEEAAGRKLGFIAQEMGREINTLGSKANEANIQILVVKMKDELEKIKEQVLNIL